MQQQHRTTLSRHEAQFAASAKAGRTQREIRDDQADGLLEEHETIAIPDNASLGSRGRDDRARTLDLHLSATAHRGAYVIDHQFHSVAHVANRLVVFEPAERTRQKQHPDRIEELSRTAPWSPTPDAAAGRNDVGSDPFVVLRGHPAISCRSIEDQYGLLSQTGPHTAIALDEPSHHPLDVASLIHRHERGSCHSRC